MKYYGIVFFILVSNSVLFAQELVNLTDWPSSIDLKVLAKKKDIIEDCEQFEKIVHSKNVEDFIFFRQTPLPQGHNIRYELILKLDLEEVRAVVTSPFVSLPDSSSYLQPSGVIRNLEMVADQDSHTTFAKLNDLEESQVNIHDFGSLKIDKRDLICDLLKNKVQIYANVDYQILLSGLSQKNIVNFIDKINLIYEKINFEKGSKFLKAVKLGYELAPMFKETNKIHHFLELFFEKNDLFFKDKWQRYSDLQNYSQVLSRNMQLKVVFDD